MNLVSRSMMRYLLPARKDADCLAAWVYQIARNVIHDHFRRPGIGAVALDGTEAAAESKNELAPLRDLARPWCAEMIEQLPEGYRQAVKLAEIEGLPQQEVARASGCRSPAQSLRIQRGRKLLKEELEQCCRFEFDRRGNLLDYEPKPEAQGLPRLRRMKCSRVQRVNRRHQAMRATPLLRKPATGTTAIPRPG